MRVSDGEIRAMKTLASQFKWSTRRIGSVFGVSTGSVSYWLRHERCHTKGIPPRRNAREVDRRRGIVKRILMSRRRYRRAAVLTANEIRRELARTHGIVVTKQTVTRDLHALDFRSVVRPRVVVTETDFSTRVRLCRKMLRLNTRNIVFSDEKIFTTNDEGWRTQWVAQGESPVPRVRLRWPPWCGPQSAPIFVISWCSPIEIVKTRHSV